MKNADAPHGRRRGRPRQFDRDEAVATALALFQARGYEGTSIADLTRAIGVSATSLYGVFPSKEVLFEEAVDLYQRTAGAFAATALENDASAEAAIRALLLGAAQRYAATGQPGGCFISLGVLSCATDHHGIAMRMATRRIEARAAIKARLDRGKDQGELQATTDTEALAAFYAATLQGLSVQARDGASDQELRRIAELAMIPLRACLNAPSQAPELSRSGHLHL